MVTVMANIFYYLSLEILSLKVDNNVFGNTQNAP